ncbi:hypothetical protein [Buchnera aphidicola]|uniref:Flagellar hook-basal body complex protein FliE n=1 Tax=Buchnera aphidicola (Cinara laricifoliae) TaxID=2518977 RepID=A0A451DAZ6_9GAMM|nr:hypothetical protein [Buchnera aphidicola]VFP83513.1 Flagellar hook-basal body complex protein FliE [Buchnera aphidicola (Cinara laricifoliae)]
MKINSSSKKIIDPKKYLIQENKNQNKNFFPIWNHALQKYLPIKNIQKNSKNTIYNSNIYNKKIKSINKKKITILIKLNEKLINVYEEIMNMQL